MFANIDQICYNETKGRTTWRISVNLAKHYKNQRFEQCGQVFSNIRDLVNTIMKKVLSALSVVGSVALPLLAAAQTPPPATPSALKSLGGLQVFICTVIVGWLFTFLVVLTIVFAFIAAFKYLTAGGDPEKVKSASSMLIYAAIAIIVALFARALPYFVSSLFGTTIGLTC
jgi:hypothetical protein